MESFSCLYFFKEIKQTHGSEQLVSARWSQFSSKGRLAWFSCIRAIWPWCQELSQKNLCVVSERQQLEAECKRNSMFSGLKVHSYMTGTFLFCFLDFLFGFSQSSYEVTSDLKWIVKDSMNSLCFSPLTWDAWCQDICLKYRVKFWSYAV